MFAHTVFQLRTFYRSLFSGLVGFVFYGGWAYWLNVSYGFDAAIKAFWVQGSYSFVLTLFMTALIETVYHFLAKLFAHTRMIPIFLTITIVCTFVFSISWWLNIVAGTPEVFRTVVLGYIVGGVYTVVYVFGLDYKEHIDIVSLEN